MSRKKRGISYVDGVVAIECPQGHVLVQVVYDTFEEYDLALFGGGDWGRGWKSDRPLDHPLALRCPTCLDKGVRMDLRGSWAKVHELAAANAQDHSSKKYTYRIGR